MTQPTAPSSTAGGEAGPAAATRSGDRSNRSVLRWVAIGVWVVVVGAWVLRLRATGTSPTESLQSFVDRLDGAWWAIPAYLAIYTVRPLVLFPASILTIAGGILFGPVVGIGVAMVGANLSALVAFQVGRVFSPTALAEGEGATVIARWSARMRERSFVTVMLMRLAFLPYDLVNYAAGFLRIRPVAFLAATAVGSLPGTVSFVLAGASLERLDAGLDGFDPKVFAASLVLFVISLVVAKVVQRREAA